MNRMDTLSRPPAASKPDSFPRRLARLVLTGPAQLASPLSRWAVTLLAVVGAALLVWSAVIHLQLWSDGYRDISVIGPLFLIQGIASIALSAGVGLFGYQESPAVPYAETSLAVEFTGAAVLVAAAVIVLIASFATRRSQRQSF
jgi:hypothetical protein